MKILKNSDLHSISPPNQTPNFAPPKNSPLPSAHLSPPKHSGNKPGTAPYSRTPPPPPLLETHQDALLESCVRRDTVCEPRRRRRRINKSRAASPRSTLELAAASGGNQSPARLRFCSAVRSDARGMRALPIFGEFLSTCVYIYIYWCRHDTGYKFRPRAMKCCQEIGPEEI